MTIKETMDNGPFEEYFKDGSLKRKGSRNCGTYAGTFEEYYPNGQLKEKGCYMNELLDGPFESYYENGQLESSFTMRQLPQILKPEHTYEVFYSTFFGNRWEPNFHSNLKDHFKSQIKFLSILGFQELANEDEIIFDRSLKDFYTRQNCESYFDNGRLKFKYAVKDLEGQSLDARIETFVLFYNNGQPKFRFDYKTNEFDVLTGDYQVFYNNGQLKEKGGFSNSDESFERFSRNGQLIEYYNNETFYKYHENGKLHYRITLEGSRKHGPYELYNQAGKLIEKGSYNYDEMYNGPYESYFEDGQIDKKCYYNNGVLDGPFYEGNGYGGVSINGYYIDGQRMDIIKRSQFIGFD